MISVIIFAGLAITITTGFVGWAGASLRAAGNLNASEQAFQVAESGIEYYRWRLAHDDDDFSGGGIYEFQDKDGIRVGEYEITVTPPPLGSTVVTLNSKGRIDADPGVEREIEVQLAIPSYARFAVVADADMRFGSGTETFGEMHSNGGIRFDGLAHNLVTSAKEDYNDPDHSGGNEFGVHTHLTPVDPLPPASVPARPDVFEAGRLFPVPEVDFDGITQDLSQMKADAQSDGYYRGPSGRRGYRLVLKTNDTFDLYRVRRLENPPGGCWDPGQSGWGTWSIRRQNFLGNFAFPNNGIIFVEDHIWVEGQIDTARLTIAAGSFPDTPSRRKNITVNNDLEYTNYDGQDVIALIAQNNFNVGLESEDDLIIDAALIAQYGRVGRHYYGWGCNPYHDRDTITLFGMIGTRLRYGFAYTDDTGYDNRIITYDANLLYSPPPNFPLTSDKYEIIRWEEL